MTPEQTIRHEAASILEEILTSREEVVQHHFRVHKVPFQSFWNGMENLYKIFEQFDVEGFNISTKYEDNDVGMVTVDVTMPLVWNKKKAVAV